MSDDDERMGRVRVALAEIWELREDASAMAAKYNGRQMDERSTIELLMERLCLFEDRLSRLEVAVRFALDPDFYASVDFADVLPPPLRLVKPPEEEE